MTLVPDDANSYEEQLHQRYQTEGAIWLDGISDPPTDADAIVIRASIISEIIKDSIQSGKHSIDVMLRAIEVRGDLELDGLPGCKTLHLEQCKIPDGLSINASSIKSLAVLNCELGAVAITNSHIQGDAAFRESKISRGMLFMYSTRIDGDLVLAGVEITTTANTDSNDEDISFGTSAKVSVLGIRVHVGVTLSVIHHFQANGSIQFIHLNVGHSIAMDGALIEATDTSIGLHATTVRSFTRLANIHTLGAIDISNIDAGNLEVKNSTVKGPFELSGCKARQVTIRNTTLDRQLDLSNSNIDGDFIVTDSQVVQVPKEISNQAINLSGAKISGDCQISGIDFGSGFLQISDAKLNGRFHLDSCTFPRSGPRAIDAFELQTVRSFGIFNVRNSQGAFNLMGMTVGGDVVIRDVTLMRLPDSGISLAVSNIAGKCIMSGIKMQGELDLSLADVRSGFILGGDLETPTVVDTVTFVNSKVGSTVRFDEYSRVVDHFDLRRLYCSGDLSISSSIGLHIETSQSSSPTDEPIFTAARATIEGNFYFRPTFLQKSGRIDLSDGRAHKFSTIASAWDQIEKSELNGFEYSRIAADVFTSIDAAKGWLKLGQHQSSFDPMPYNQLAAAFDRSGMSSLARGIRIERERERTRKAHFPLKLWSLLFDFVARYGYESGRAVFLVVALIAVGSILYWGAFSIGAMRPSRERVLITPKYEMWHASGADMKNIYAALPQDYPRFNAIGYAIDSFVPFLTLNQDTYWRVISWGRAGDIFYFLDWLYQGAGWFTTTIVVAALLAYLKRGEER